MRPKQAEDITRTIAIVHPNTYNTGRVEEDTGDKYREKDLNPVGTIMIQEKVYINRVCPGMQIYIRDADLSQNLQQ